MVTVCVCVCVCEVSASARSAPARALVPAPLRGVQEIAQDKGVWCGLLARDFSGGTNALDLRPFAAGRDAREAYRSQLAHSRARRSARAAMAARRSARRSARRLQQLVEDHWELELVPRRLMAHWQHAPCAVLRATRVALALLAAGAGCSPVVRLAVLWWLEIAVLPLCRVVAIPAFFGYAATPGGAREVRELMGPAAVLYRGVYRVLTSAWCLAAYAHWWWAWGMSVYEVVLWDYVVRRNGVSTALLAFVTSWPRWSLVAARRLGLAPKTKSVRVFGVHVIASAVALFPFMAAVRRLVRLDAHGSGLAVLLAWTLRLVLFLLATVGVVIHAVCGARAIWRWWRTGHFYFETNRVENEPRPWDLVPLLRFACYFELCMEVLLGAGVWRHASPAEFEWPRLQHIALQFVGVCVLIGGSFGVPALLAVAATRRRGEKALPIISSAVAFIAAVVTYRVMVYNVRTRRTMHSCAHTRALWLALGRARTFMVSCCMRWLS